MVQNLTRTDPGYGDLGRAIGGNFSEGYKSRADEMALQKVIGGLPENAEPQQILEAILGANTYGAQAKEKVLKQYGEMQSLKQQRAQLAESSRANIAREEETQRANMAREGIELAKANTPETSDWDKGLVKANVKRLTKAYDDVAIAKQSLGRLDKLRGLAEGLKGVSGYWKTWWRSAEAAELKADGFTALQPVIKIFNPSGVLAQKKLQTLEERYAIKDTDWYSTTMGKIKALELMARDAETLNMQWIKLLTEYKGNPPPEKIAEFAGLNESIVDAYADADPESFSKEPVKAKSRKASDYKEGTILKDPKTGNKRKVVDGKWVAV